MRERIGVCSSFLLYLELGKDVLPDGERVDLVGLDVAALCGVCLGKGWKIIVVSDARSGCTRKKKQESHLPLLPLLLFLTFMFDLPRTLVRRASSVAAYEVPFSMMRCMTVT